MVGHWFPEVISWGHGCGEAEFPGVYARVSSGLDACLPMSCYIWLHLFPPPGTSVLML